MSASSYIDCAEGLATLERVRDPLGALEDALEEELRQ